LTPLPPIRQPINLSISCLRNRLCESPECIHAASNILYNLHPNYTNIDPCTDFDQYACGGWQERHDMRPEQGSIFTGTVMIEHVQSQLRHIMESPQTPDPADSDNFQKLRAAYDACRDESTIQERGTKPLDDMLAGLAKIYPESPSKGVEDNLTDAVVYLMKTGTVALADSSVYVSASSFILNLSNFEARRS
jgi:endothelin-converting enzyme